MATSIATTDPGRARLPGPPGPRGHWLLGNLAEFREDRLAFLAACARDYGDVAALRLGAARIGLLSHPDLVEEVLVHKGRHSRKHFALRAARPSLGNGLLTGGAEAGGSSPGGTSSAG